MLAPSSVAEKTRRQKQSVQPRERSDDPSDLRSRGESNSSDCGSGGQQQEQHSICVGGCGGCCRECGHRLSANGPTQADAVAAASFAASVCRESLAVANGRCSHWFYWSVLRIINCATHHVAHSRGIPLCRRPHTPITQPRMLATGRDRNGLCPRGLPSKSRRLFALIARRRRQPQSSARGRRCVASISRGILRRHILRQSSPR